jgi:Predicted choline kinase involved in LPS biosynthesis
LKLARIIRIDISNLDDQRSTTMEMLPGHRERIEHLIGSPIREIRRARGGYSAAQRWILATDSGLRIFAKIGVPPVSDHSLRCEALVYERLRLSFMPRVLEWQDDPVHPMLLLEDLSDYEWPPPWNNRSIERTLSAIQDLHESECPIRSHEQLMGSADPNWWSVVADRPESFLELRVRSREWLDRALPTLLEASASISPEGQSLCHFDLRSDNICLSDERVAIIDWSLACRGNPRVDLGLFLPGLASEGGPRPEQILPGAPEIAAWVSGFFAAHASKPFIPSAPNVRVMQRTQLEWSLAWLERERGF